MLKTFVSKITVISQKKLIYYKYYCNILVIIMCKKEKEECEFKDNPKGCALEHVSKARELLSKGDTEGADLELSHIEKHWKE